MFDHLLTCVMISWSPDGKYLVTPNALKQKKHIASVINRGTWEQECNFAGQSDVICVAVCERNE